MSYGQYVLCKPRDMDWILYKDSGRANNLALVWNPMSILKLALLSMILTAAGTEASSQIKAYARYLEYSLKAPVLEPKALHEGVVRHRVASVGQVWL